MGGSRVIGVGVVCAVVWTSVTWADPIASDRPPTNVAATTPAPTRDWHIGMNLRTDFAARFYRADVGVRVRDWDFIVVLDPFGLQSGDYDYDGIVRYSVNRDWSVWSGARVTTVPIGRSRQFSDKFLAGVSAVMPWFIPRTRLHSGLELAVHVVSHGAGLPTNYVCIDSPICRKDHFVFSLFARFEYVSPF
ncbi:MAG: hypothetical protein M4D80_05565 [Myxococcota bacterium]|nr:hypothetical protein [Deltaproteobacteria bacterium]MDQ3334606.1 hypothetical protein [Myxococcota bacterium]